MLKLKIIVPAFVIALTASGGASALPAAQLNDMLISKSESLVEEVQYRRPPPPRRYYPRRLAPRYYRPGQRLRSAPRGYRRYQARPRDWQRRGCVVVGPVWFCP